jgi:hypothetical protein
MSAEFVQEQKSGDEHGKWNPEVNVGGDDAKQIAGTGGFSVGLRHSTASLHFDSAAWTAILGIEKSGVNALSRE